MINLLNKYVDSEPALLIINGLPRIVQKDRGNKESIDYSTSTGLIEKLVPGMKLVASSNNAAYCDTMSYYLNMSAAERKRLYKDTIHPTPVDGQQALGERIYECLKTILE